MNIRKLSKKVFKAPVEIVQGAWDAFEETVLGCEHDWQDLPRESNLVEHDQVCPKCGAERDL